LIRLSATSLSSSKTLSEDTPQLHQTYSCGSPSYHCLCGYYRVHHIGWLPSYAGGLADMMPSAALASMTSSIRGHTEIDYRISILYAIMQSIWQAIIVWRSMD
jgi:hypothetical protein